MNVQTAKQEGQEGSSSFLKKRTKKLLLMLSLAALKKKGSSRTCHTQTSKSFLVLFFKKELLTCRPFIY
jgi:hypothetical protein